MENIKIFACNSAEGFTKEICDNLGLLHKGGILFESDIDSIKTNMYKVQISLKDDFSKDLRLSYTTRFNNLYELEKNMSLSSSSLLTTYSSFGISSVLILSAKLSIYLYGAFLPIKYASLTMYVISNISRFVNTTLVWLNLRSMS